MNQSAKRKVISSNSSGGRNYLSTDTVFILVAYGSFIVSMSADEERNASESQNSERQIVNCLLSHERSAAAIICSLKIHHSLLPSVQLTKDVLGVVATLGKVNDDNLSRSILFTI